MMRRGWLITGGLLAAVGLSTWLLAGGEPAERPAPERGDAGQAYQRVERRDLIVRVLASGELEASEQVDIKSLIDGRTTIVEIVEEGTTVKAGDPLVRLAEDGIRTELESAHLELERATADRVAAEQELAIQESEAESERRAAELKLALAELELQRWLSGTDPQRQRELRVAMETAERRLTTAARDEKLSEQLYAEQFISLSELEQDRVERIEAENTLETARLDATVYEKYERPKELKRVHSDVDEARAELSRAVARNTSRLASAQAKLRSSTQSLVIREQKLVKLQEQLAATTITAPRDGLVIYASSVGNSRRRTQEPIAAGREVVFNQSILYLPDTRGLVAAVQVHESMLPLVKVGQRATVTVEALPARPLSGRVKQIGVTAVDGGWMNPDLREYLVRIELDPVGDDRLKPAMRCEASIESQRIEGALTVPIQAVRTEGDERFCVMADGSRRRVETGRVSESWVEVLSGLNEGERVSLSPR